MSKKEPGSKKNSSPKNDNLSENRNSESEIPVKPLVDPEEPPLQETGESESKDISEIKAKNEDSGTPPAHLEDEGDWAEESKFVLAGESLQSEVAPERPVVLPPAYGLPRLVFLVRDPNWIFAFWEVPPENAHELLARLNKTWDEVHWVLRMYSPGKELASSENTWDTAIDPAAAGWYLHLSPPGASFQGEIGLCDNTGQFAGLICSNIATLPPDRPSPYIDEQWPLTETDHQTHYAGLPVADLRFEANPTNPELIEQWQAGRPSSRPNPFQKR